MAAEDFIISNPKGNNRDLLITFQGQDGARKKFKTLRPGEACRCDKRQVGIEAVVRPPRLLLLEDGSYVADSRKGPRAAVPS